MILQNSEPLELLNLLNNASHVQNENAYMYMYFISELRTSWYGKFVFWIYEPSQLLTFRKRRNASRPPFSLGPFQFRYRHFFCRGVLQA